MTAAELLLLLSTAHAQNQLKSVMQRAVNAYRLLIIDEIGYLPMTRDQANLFFQVIAARHKRQSDRDQQLGVWPMEHPLRRGCDVDGRLTGSSLAPCAYCSDCRRVVPAQASTSGGIGTEQDGKEGSVLP